MFKMNAKILRLVLDAGLAVLGLAAVWYMVGLIETGHIKMSALVGAALAAIAVVRYHFPAGYRSKDGEEGDVSHRLTAVQETSFFEDLTDRLPDPMFVVTHEDPDLGQEDPVRRIAYANAEARRLFKMSAAGAFLSKAMRQPEVLEAIEDVLKDGGSRVVEYQALGPVDRFWRATVSLIARDQKRGAARVMVVMRDETAAKRNERMRADFLANASHELRTPLASLSGFIETLRGHAKDDPAAQDRFLDIMQIQADRMRRLINDLLSLSRIELNEHVPPSTEVNLGEVVSEILEGVVPIAADRKMTIVAPDVMPKAPLLGDRHELTQIVQNLVDNAVKYSDDEKTVRVEIIPDADAEQALTPADPGAPRVSVLTPDVSPDGHYVVFRVYDEGRGVDRQYLPRLSERFYRVEGQKSGAREGTGLGLAIVKHIVNRHRGGFMIESRVGKGSVFSVYFPRAPLAE
jgi:two-component system phosphate regulon sensor histidine kinase PhoR